MQIFADRCWTARGRVQGFTSLSSRRVRLAAFVLGLTALMLPATAGAAPNEPPALPHTIISFPQRDFVSAAGFADGDNVVITVIRNGVQIGVTPPIPAQDDTTTAGFDGIVEVNHPGGGCWTTNTPDISPGDIVRTTIASSATAGNVGVQDQTTTANVTTQAPTNPSSGRIVVHGTARTAAGARLPDGQVEQRFVTTGNLFQRNGKRTLRAGGAAPATDGGKFSWDGSTTNWTVEYTGLSAADVTEVMRSDPRALWLGANPGTGQELTIYESSFFGGPTAPCTAPLASNGVTATDHVYNTQPTINSINVTTALGLSGVAQSDATAVSVKLTDGAGSSTTAVAGTLSAGAGGKTWTATIPAAGVAALADGTLTASVTVTTPGGALAGTTLSIKKDVVASAAPTATPPGGTYTTTQSVSLFDSDANASILYTTNGSTPATSANATTLLYSTPIGVNASQTIKALAVDTAGNPSTVSTDAYALVAKPTLTPGSIDYGSQPYNTPSTGLLVTLKNTGAASMTVSAVGFTGANAGDFVRGINTCTGVTLAPGDSCTVDNVRFVPQADGSRTASLTFTDDAPGATHSVALTGTGFGAPATTAPVIAISPASLAFPDTTEGTVSALKTVTVTNNGNAPLVIGTTPVAGTDFAVNAASSTCAGTSVAAGGTCTVDVRFNPAAAGAKTGTLTINDNAAGNPHTVALSGNATAAAPPPAPVAAVTPASRTYTGQAVGTTSAAQTATITNSGNAALTLSVALAGTNPGDYVITANGGCPASLAAGASCIVSVTFKPTATGARSAVLRFTDNSGNVAGSTQDVTLTGTGTAPPAPAITATPNPLAFGNSTVPVAGFLGIGSKPGVPVSKTLTVTNSGTAALAITTSTIGAATTSSFPGDYSITTNNCLNKTLPAATPTTAAGTCTIVIKLQAKAKGARNAALTINSNAPTGALKVNMTGAGI
jgi:hypothetical protein